MQHHKLSQQYGKVNPLHAIKGGLLQPQQQLANLVNAAWNFAYSSLWNSSQFSQTEAENAKEKIATFLQLFKDYEKGFSVFCQRVLLARYYVSKNSSRYIPLPSIWLDKENATGFAGTKTWFEDVKKVRTSLPNYKQEIKAMAEAVLEFSQEPTVQNYQYWRTYFMDREATGLLNLFQVVAIQQLCNN
jgi:hypothetical protein